MVELSLGAWPARAADVSGFVAAFVVAFAVTGFLVARLLAAAFFFGRGFFFFVVGLSGIGVVMPGMCWCCATAGADTAASASALAAANNFIVTESLLRSGFGREISGVSWRRRCDLAHVTVIECRKEIHRRRARKGRFRDRRGRLDRQPDENGNAAAVAIRLFAMAGRR